MSMQPINLADFVTGIHSMETENERLKKSVNILTSIANDAIREGDASIQFCGHCRLPFYYCDGSIYSKTYKCMDCDGAWCEECADAHMCGCYTESGEE